MDLRSGGIEGDFDCDLLAASKVAKGAVPW